MANRGYGNERGALGLVRAAYRRNFSKGGDEGIEAEEYDPYADDSDQPQASPIAVQPDDPSGDQPSGDIPTPQSFAKVQRLYDLSDSLGSGEDYRGELARERAAITAKNDAVRQRILQARRILEASATPIRGGELTAYASGLMAPGMAGERGFTAGAQNLDDYRTKERDYQMRLAQTLGGLGVKEAEAGRAGASDDYATTLRALQYKRDIENQAIRSAIGIDRNEDSVKNAELRARIQAQEGSANRASREKIAQQNLEIREKLGTLSANTRTAISQMVIDGRITRDEALALNKQQLANIAAHLKDAARFEDEVRKEKAVIRLSGPGFKMTDEQAEELARRNVLARAAIVEGQQQAPALGAPPASAPMPFTQPQPPMQAPQVQRPPQQFGAPPPMAPAAQQLAPGMAVPQGAPLSRQIPPPVLNPSVSQPPPQAAPQGAGAVQLPGGPPSNQALSQLPPKAVAQLKEGVTTVFRNGTSWTLRGGVPVRIK